MGCFSRMGLTPTSRVPQKLGYFVETALFGLRVGKDTGLVDNWRPREIKYIYVPR